MMCMLDTQVLSIHIHIHIYMYIHTHIYIYIRIYRLPKLVYVEPQDTSSLGTSDRIYLSFCGLRFKFRV